MHIFSKHHYQGRYCFRLPNINFNTIIVKLFCIFSLVYSPIVNQWNRKKNTNMWLCDYPNYLCLNARLEISSSDTCSTFQNRCHGFTSRFSRYGESDQWPFHPRFPFFIFFLLTPIFCLSCITCTFPSRLSFHFFQDQLCFIWRLLNR